MPYRLPSAALALAGLVCIAACSGSSEPSASPTSSATEALSPTSEPTSTTIEPSSSTTTYDDVEAAVREVHTRFMTELWAVDERADGPEAALPLIEELTTGAQKARMTEGIERALESGERLVSPGYVSNIVSVSIEGEQASVDDCSLGRGELYSAEGELITPAGDYFILRTTVLIFIENRWYVEDFWVGGDEQCEPGA